jgi:hypothetical protein
MGYPGILAPFTHPAPIAHWNGSSFTVSTLKINGFLAGISCLPEKVGTWCTGLGETAVGSDAPGKLMGGSFVVASSGHDRSTPRGGALTRARSVAAVPPWAKVNIASPGPNPDFSSITCLSTTNCWAPGYGTVTRKGTASTYALMEHWAGAGWSPVVTPPLGGELGRVDCASATECWVAGYVEAPSGLASPVLEHWDGGAWIKVSLPGIAVADKQAYLDSVTCLSLSDCYALGGAGASTNAPFAPLVFHFDGSTWSVLTDVPVPKGYKSADLEQMRCLSATTCVAEGIEIPEGSYFDHVYSQILHGSNWEVDQMPQPYHFQFSFSDAADLSCSGGQCVAAVNATPDANGQSIEAPFLEVWNSSSWTLLNAAAASVGRFGDFTDIACLADDNCWATMSAGGDGEVNEWLGGKSWKRGSAPGAVNSSLDAVGCVPSAACFVLGTTRKGVAIADQLVVAR